jgi:hypothetical protein
MDKKTEDCPVCSVAVESPIPNTHPPKEKDEILQDEPTKRVEFGGSSRVKDGETEGLGESVKGEENGGGEELFGGKLFRSDVPKEEGFILMAESGRIHFLVGEGYGDGYCEEGRKEGDELEVGSLLGRGR